jgi:hypothetical protein
MGGAQAPNPVQFNQGQLPGIGAFSNSTLNFGGMQPSPTFVPPSNTGTQPAPMTGQPVPAMGQFGMPSYNQQMQQMTANAQNFFRQRIRPTGGPALF